MMLTKTKLIVRFITLLFLAGCAGVQPAKTTTLGDGITGGSSSQQTIALMLPLQGRYKTQGQAIRNGFLAAYYYDKKHRSVQNRVNIMDTQSASVAELYQKAVAGGANAIVGPLTKPHVEDIARLTPSIPVLALNQNSQASSPHLYQFGLSPVDEAVEIARKASSFGYKNALIIAPKSQRGELLANTLSHQWRAQDGAVADTFLFSGNMPELSTHIAKLLKVVEVDTGNPKSTPKRREDIDVILLVANPVKAREIRGLLKFNYAGKIPIFAASSLYNPQLSATENSDLDGVYFCTTPWMLPQHLPEKLRMIRQSIQQLWAQDFNRNPDLYALGVDAYDLISHTANPQTGATGILTIDTRNNIHRRLPWAQFRGGIPVLMGG